MAPLDPVSIPFSHKLKMQLTDNAGADMACTIGIDFVSILQVIFMQFAIVAVIESVLGICLYAIARIFVNMIFNHNIANFVLFIFTWYQFAIIIGAIFLINLIVGTWKTHKIFDGAVSTKYGE